MTRSEADITLQDLRPTAEDLQRLAYLSTAGDPASVAPGRHGGRDWHRPDAQGRSKEEIFERAAEADREYFDRLATEVNTRLFKTPPSIRTRIPKDREDPSKGLRPIDAPAEIKRLQILHVVEALRDRVEDALHPGQFGYRPYEGLVHWCGHAGATSMDHMASGMWLGIRSGHRWAVSIDLKDAFGLVPKEAVIRSLRQLGLTRNAARYVWRLVRIDAVDSQQPRRRHVRRGRGTEQGNALSALVLNLVLAPLLYEVEIQTGCLAFAYADDIYLLAQTFGHAIRTFHALRALAREAGFTNVRRLADGTDPRDSKLSRIIDSWEQPVVVLKTYEIDALGISPEVSKVLELRRAGSLVGGRVGINRLRKATGCMALTKAATRTRTNILFPRPASRVRNDATLVGEVTAGLPRQAGLRRLLQGQSGTGAEAPVLAGTGEGNLPSAGDHPHVQMNDRRAYEKEGGDDIDLPYPTRGLVIPNHVLELPRDDAPEDADRLVSSTSETERDQLRAASYLELLPVQGEGRSQKRGLAGWSQEATNSVLPLILPIGDTSSEDHVQVGCPGEILGTGTSFPSVVPFLKTEPGQPLVNQVPDQATGGDTPGRRGRVISGDRSPSYLPLLDPETVHLLLEGRRVGHGNRFKGHILDLAGLGHVLGEVGQDLTVESFRRALHGLIKVVRDRGHAAVVYDPREAWPYEASLLGGQQDQVYRRGEQETLQDGRRLVHLYHRRPRRRQRDPLPPPGAEIVLLDVALENRALRTYRIRYTLHGRPQEHRQEIPTPERGAGTMAGLAWLLQSYPCLSVGVPACGTFGVLHHLVEGRLQPAHVVWARAFSEISKRRWGREGDFYVGAPLRTPVANAG